MGVLVHPQRTLVTGLGTNEWSCPEARPLLRTPFQSPSHHSAANHTVLGLCGSITFSLCRSSVNLLSTVLIPLCLWSEAYSSQAQHDGPCCSCLAWREDNSNALCQLQVFGHVPVIFFCLHEMINFFLCSTYNADFALQERERRFIRCGECTCRKVGN